MAGAAANSPELRLGVTWKVSVWLDSSPGPAVMFVAQWLTVCVPALLLTVWSAPLVNDGASFTGVTKMVKVCEAEVSTPPKNVPPLSFKAIVITDEPFAFAAGVKVKVPLALTAGAVEKIDG